MKRLFLLLLMPLSIFAIHCGDDGSPDSDSNSDSDADTDSDSSSDLETDSAGDADSDSDGDVDSETTTNGPETVCNGIDDDGNGIIDDVDLGGDGICDCLNIATVGIPGTWGEGNVFGDWLAERSSTEVVNLGSAILDDAALEPFRVIVFLNVGEGADGIQRQYSADETAALQRWIGAGGGVMTTIGYADYPEEVDNINRLLSPYDMYYGTVPVLQKEGDQTIPVTTWQAHPTTEGISAVGVDNGYEVLENQTVVAEEQGIQLAEVFTYGEGNIFVWGDEWICYDSEWQNIADYQIERFWLNIIKWLTPEDECQVPGPV